MTSAKLAVSISFKLRKKSLGNILDKIGPKTEPLRLSEKNLLPLTARLKKFLSLVLSLDDVDDNDELLLWIVIMMNCYYDLLRKVDSEAATGGVLWKKVFLKISQYSQKNSCARVSFLIKLLAHFLQNTSGRLLLWIQSHLQAGYCRRSSPSENISGAEFNFWLCWVKVWSSPSFVPSTKKAIYGWNFLKKHQDNVFRDQIFSHIFLILQFPMILYFSVD